MTVARRGLKIQVKVKVMGRTNAVSPTSIEGSVAAVVVRPCYHSLLARACCEGPFFEHPEVQLIGPCRVRLDTVSVRWRTVIANLPVMNDCV